MKPTMSMCINEVDYLKKMVKWQQMRINQLENGMKDLLEVAYRCDGWESFPSNALEDAEKTLGS